MTLEFVFFFQQNIMKIHFQYNDSFFGRKFRRLTKPGINLANFNFMTHLFSITIVNIWFIYEIGTKTLGVKYWNSRLNFENYLLEHSNDSFVFSVFFYIERAFMKYFFIRPLLFNHLVSSSDFIFTVLIFFE